MTAKRYHLYAEPELWQQFQTAAEQAGLSVSGWLRLAAREKMARSVKPAVSPPGEIPEVKRYPSSTHSFTGKGDEHSTPNEHPYLHPRPAWLRPPS